jgi:hypothetical protein
MRFFWALLCAWLVCASACVGQVTTTTVSDTVYSADGSPAQGSLLISWPQFSTMSGASIAAGSTTVTLSSGGGLSVTLAPNAGSNPIGSYYTVLYHLNDGTVTRENWVVPVSSTAVNLAAVRSTVMPTSVAMQTVSKAYVDRAVAGIPVGATAVVAGTVKLAAGQTSTTLAAVATTGSAADLSAGTLADARLSSNVPLLNAASNTFTGSGGLLAGSYNIPGGVGGFYGAGGNFQGMQSTIGARLQLISYWGLELRGDQQATTATVTGGASDASVTVYGMHGDTQDVMDWDNNAGTKLASVDAGGDIATSGRIAPQVSTPGSSSVACAVGQMWTDASYIYVCTATNTIKRSTLSSF